MSVVKIVKDGIFVIIDDSVCWNVHRGIGAEFCRGVDYEVNMSNL